MHAAAAALALAALLAASAAQADQKAEGAAHIRQMAGCHAVTYRFYEDGQHDHFNPNSALKNPIRELVRIDADAPGSITLSHASIGREEEPVPHWHEVWTFDERGRAWTQAVWSRAPQSPNRDLRYSCTAPWTGNLWECHAGRAPKPFRDDGAPFGYWRADYEWLDRFNAVLVTERGWVHNERNRKMAANGRVVSHELGWILYERLPPEHCTGGARR